MLINPVRVWRALEARGARQHYGQYLKPDFAEHSYDLQCRCALGWLAGEVAESESQVDNLLEDALTDTYGFSNLPIKMDCACDYKNNWKPSGIIPHLNDGHRMTFGQIADYVEAHAREFFTPEALVAFGYGADR